MAVTGFEIYRLYLGVKLHFTTANYDVVAAGGYVKCGQQSYARRKDRAIFEALASKYTQPREVIKYLIANFAYGNSGVLYDRQKGLDLLTKWIRIKESMSKVFSDDLSTISQYARSNKIDVSAAFDVNGVTAILKLVKAERITIETACLICTYMPELLDAWDKMPECKLLFKDELLRIRKLRTFIKPTELTTRVWDEFKEDLNCT